jgi:molybdopterin-containing oxidoreductase family iron-sulfur binding subunit
MSDNKEKNKRRDFLKKGFTLGITAIAGAGIAQSLHHNGKFNEKKVKVITTDGKLVEVDESQVLEAPKCVQPAIGEDARKGIPGRKFVMVIDLAKCNNARKCVEACQKGHDLLPNQEWMKVHPRQKTEFNEPYWMPQPCYQCDNPSCVKVCPVGATFKRSDGIVLVDADRCIGCKFCIMACPYSARTFNWAQKDSYQTNAENYSPETSVPGQMGTVGKCDFCPDLSRNGKLPYCASNCPMGAIYFGDANEDTITNGAETVRFRAKMTERSGYQFMKELGTAPRVYYLPPANKSFEFENGKDYLNEEQKERYNEVLSEIKKANESK